MHTNTKDAIAATPPGSKRDKLERIAALGWGIRRVKRGKHTVIELLQPDSGGTYNVWTVKTETDLDLPGLLVALHWGAHGSNGLAEIKARVWAGNSGTMTAEEAARDWFTLPPHYRHTAALAERFAAFAASQNAAMTAEIARLRDELDNLADANLRQAHCINLTAQALGPDYAATIDGLPKAAKHVAVQFTEARAALHEAEVALACCYNVVDWPADGRTMQDMALKRVRDVLTKEDDHA